MSASCSVLPSVSALLSTVELQVCAQEHSLFMVRHWIRMSLEQRRNELLAAGSIDSDQPHNDQPHNDRAAEMKRMVQRVQTLAGAARSRRLHKVVNATGVVLHTSLGRAPLSPAAVEAMVTQARCSNLELDLEDGQRRYRGYQIVEQLQVLTGCEDALVVNNNAAATLLTLQTFAGAKAARPESPGGAGGHSPSRGVSADVPAASPGSETHAGTPHVAVGAAHVEVVISRGQLIEIGGAFRLPEIFELSGVKMREVGTTNRTRCEDYLNAITPHTAAVLRVHPSNYQVTGFSGTPDITSLCEAIRPFQLPVIDDIGSGCLMDMRQFGLPAEPTFGESIAAGASLVLGSGDKLLGGPQCGIIIGKAALIARMRQLPLARVVRVDKLTLAALAATLDAYLRQESSSLVVHQLLHTPLSVLRNRAEFLRSQFPPAQDSTAAAWRVEIADEVAEVGGGSLPGATLPTAVLRIQSDRHPADVIARRLRTGQPALVPRVREEWVLVDLRSVAEDELGLVQQALLNLVSASPRTSSEADDRP